MEARIVVKGTLYVAAQNTTQMIIAFIFYILISRILSKAEVGELSLLMFTVSVFNLTMLSVPVAATRFISENLGRGDQVTMSAVSQTTLRLALATGLPSLILACLLSQLLSPFIGSTPDIVVLVFFTAFFGNLLTLFNAQLQGLGLFLEMTLLSLGATILFRFGGTLLAWVGYGLRGVVIGWLTANILASALAYIFLRKRLPPSQYGFATKKILLYSYPLWVAAILGLLQGWLDMVLLYTLTTDLTSVGTYYLILGSASTLGIVTTAITTTIFPAMVAQHGAMDVEAVIAALKMGIRFLSLTVLPVGLSLAATARSTVTIAYGPSFLSGAPALAILTATAIIPALTALFTATLQAIGETPVLVKVGVASVAVNAFTTLILATPLGGSGAALARTATSLTALTLTYHAVKTHLKPFLNPPPTAFKKAGILSMALATPLALIDMQALNLMLKVAIEALTFLSIGFLALRALKPLEAQDFQLMRLGVPKPFHGVLDVIEQVNGR